MSSIPRSRSTTHRISESSCAWSFTAPLTSKHPQLTAWPRARLIPIAMMKTTSSAPMIVAELRRQIPRISAAPARSSTHGITSAAAFTAKPGTIR